MKVYCVKPNATMCGGCAIVAASSANEALRMVNESTSIYKDNYVDLFAMRIVHLEGDYNEPRVIVDEIYIEDI